MDMVAFADRLLAGPNRVSEDTVKGITIIYKNGTKDWFDPVVDEKTEDGILKVTIENGNVYNVNLSDTVLVNYYNMFEEVSK